ncbi:cytochrome P450 [Streptomyces sp. NBC_00019]|uniref:cytochrome P450 n=1 Tax=Streptomyces sp. NBC_00019 TaxID=2975623 RepID=UPI002F91AD46
MDSPVRYGHAPGALPLVGHAHRFLGDPLPFMMSLPQHGDLVRIKLGTSSALVICDPVLARRALREDRVFDKGGPVISRMREILGNGLVACPHSDHRRQRRLIQTAFRRDRLAGYARTMLEQIEGVVGSWRHGEVLDVPVETKRLTTNVTVASMFANRIAPDQAQQVVDDFATVSAVGLARTMVPTALLRLPLPANRRHDQARDRLRTAVKDMIARARTEDSDRDDLLSMLIRTDEESGDALTDEEVVDQICTFFVAGVDTTANLLASALHLIVHHPALHDALTDEAARVVAHGPLAYERLPELPLTERVVTEALRLYPPGWMIARYTAADTDLGGHRIPAGTFVIVSPYQVQRSPAVYDRPEDFDPERWLAADKTGRDAFLPFGAGARKCIGDEFAHIEAVLAIATIMSRWQLSPVTGPDYVPRCYFNLRPVNLRITVTEPARATRAHL